jgi:ATP synthase protein I
MTETPGNPPAEAPHVKTVLKLAAAMQRYALLIAVPVALGGVVLGFVLRGGGGAVGAAMGALLGLAVGAVSTWVMRATAAASPAGVMIGAMTSFAGKILLLLVVLVAFRGTTLFDNRSFGLALLAVTAAWIAGEVVGFVRTKVPSVDV